QEEQARVQRMLGAEQMIGAQDAAIGQFGLQTGLQGEMAQRQLNDQRAAALMQGQLASQQMGAGILGQELAAQQAYELARTGNLLQADAQSAQLVSGRGNALIGGIASMGGAAMGLGLMSDARSKEEIQ